MMGEKDPVAAAAQKYKPIQSAVPGTTLGPIQIEAFLNGGVRWTVDHFLACWARSYLTILLFIKRGTFLLLSLQEISFSQIYCCWNIVIQKIFDTPGVHLHHRQAAVVHVEDLPCLAPQSRLKSQAFSFIILFCAIADCCVLFVFNSLRYCLPDDFQLPTLVDSSLNGQTLFWGGLVRVDILEVVFSVSLNSYLYEYLCI